MISRPAAAAPERAIEALQLDALLTDDRLRAWIEAQPASSWREARILNGRLSAVSDRYERSATATLHASTGRVTTWLPGPHHRAERFATAPASLPRACA